MSKNHLKRSLFVFRNLDNHLTISDALASIAVGMAENAKEFVDKGSEIYQGNLPEGVKEHH